MADDYISRQTAINAICKDWCNRDYCGDCFFHGAKQAIDVLKALPDADVQPVVQCKYCKHSTESKLGRWIKDGHHIKCDRCGQYMCDKDREGDPIPQNFCPNCGARMDGEQNGSID